MAVHPTVSAQHPLNTELNYELYRTLFAESLQMPPETLSDRTLDRLTLAIDPPTKKLSRDDSRGSILLTVAINDLSWVDPETSICSFFAQRLDFGNLPKWIRPYIQNGGFVINYVIDGDNGMLVLAP